MVYFISFSIIIEIQFIYTMARRKQTARKGYMRPAHQQQLTEEDVKKPLRYHHSRIKGNIKKWRKKQLMKAHLESLRFILT